MEYLRKGKKLPRKHTLPIPGTANAAVYKSGTGTSGRCVGTWDLGTRDEVLEDIKYGTRGRVGRGRGYVWDGETEDAGCE